VPRLFFAKRVFWKGSLAKTSPIIPAGWPLKVTSRHGKGALISLNPTLYLSQPDRRIDRMPLVSSTTRGDIRAPSFVLGPQNCRLPVSSTTSVASAQRRLTVARGKTSLLLGLRTRFTTAQPLRGRPTTGIRADFRLEVCKVMFQGRNGWQCGAIEMRIDRHGIAHVRNPSPQNAGPVPATNAQ